MTTAANLINDALQWINVSSGIMPAEPDQQSRSFKLLQRMYEILPAQNVYLQLQRPASVSADLREPSYATEALVHILGKMAAPYFQAQLGPLHEEAYQDSISMLRRKTGRIARPRYPDTLPIGSGNYCDADTFFYVDDGPSQLALFDEANVGESRTYTADFNPEAQRRNTTVATVDWSNLADRRATISNQAVVSNIASARLTYGENGPIRVRARCTFANGEVYDWILHVSVVEPVINES